MPIDQDSMAAIRRAQNRYAREIEQIRGNVMLSEEGKRRQMAVARHRALAEITQLREAATAAWSARKAELEKQLFSIRDQANGVEAAISYRDAQDRVAELKTAAEAQLLLRRAIRTGDDLLARALFERAWDVGGDRMAGSGWTEIIHAYVEQLRPDLAPAVEELAVLQNADTRAGRMAEQMETGVHVPPEIAAMSPAEVAQAVTEAAAGS